MCGSMEDLAEACDSVTESVMGGGGKLVSMQGSSTVHYLYANALLSTTSPCAWAESNAKDAHVAGAHRVAEYVTLMVMFMTTLLACDSTNAPLLLSFSCWATLEGPSNSMPCRHGVAPHTGMSFRCATTRGVGKWSRRRWRLG